MSSAEKRDLGWRYTLEAICAETFHSPIQWCEPHVAQATREHFKCKQSD